MPSSRPQPRRSRPIQAKPIRSRHQRGRTRLAIGVRTWQRNFRQFTSAKSSGRSFVPLKLTPYAVAAALNVPRTRIERIAREEKPVTADTALRLGKFFKTGAAFWMNMQARFDLETAEDVLAPQIKKIASYQAA